MSHALTTSERINSVLRPFPVWAVYLLGALPGLYIIAGVALAYRGVDLFRGELGIDPSKTIELWTGILALRFFIGTMLISALRDYARLKLIKFRRPLGLLAFFYALLHLTVWLGLDLQFFWGEVWSDILKRPYITVGMLGFALMIPLALTSRNSVIKRLGPVRWQRIHWLSYPAILLGAVHFVMVQKVWETEALIYIAIVLLLLTLRGRRLIPR